MRLNENDQFNRVHILYNYIGKYININLQFYTVVRETNQYIAARNMRIC